jgi:hypothetical protein
MSMLASLKNLVDMEFLSMFSPQRQLLGLDIGSSSIKLVQIKEHRGHYTLQKFGIKELEPEVIVDGTVMDEGRVVSAIKELLAEKNVKLKQVAISISGHAVIVKKISLPPMPDEELEAQVKLSAEQYIPFDINEVNLDFHVLPPSESPDEQSEMSIVLVAAKKDKINELTELVKAAGLDSRRDGCRRICGGEHVRRDFPRLARGHHDSGQHRGQRDECEYCGWGRVSVHARYSFGWKPIFRGCAAGNGCVSSRRRSNSRRATATKIPRWRR